MVRSHREAAEELARLRFSGSRPRGSDCPPESVLMNLAAGIFIKDSEIYVNHAAQCEHCGPLLREVASDLAEGLSLEDEKRMEQLRSASPEWQRDFAQRLSGADQPSGAASWWRSVFTLPRLALAGGLASAMALAFWLSFSSSKPSPAQDLLAQAYEEKRTVEMRFEGVPYTKLSQDRGPDAARSHMNRPALLRAETEIAQHLESAPDNVTWLHASGRASLLEADGETAVTSLERARRLAPDDQSIAIDLASAYFQRGESLGRPEDDGRAVDLLGKVLSENPKNEVAQFNYAIALEHISLYQQAMAQWRTFLEAHPNSGWASEARARLSQLQEKVRQNQSQSRSRVEDAGAIATALQTDRSGAVLDSMNTRAENYLEIAVRDWLPGSLTRNRDALGSEADRVALGALAEILETRHEDSWLHDILKADPNVTSLRAAFMLMSDINHSLQISDNDRAAKEAQRATLLFKSSGVRAGELYSRFQMAYANQLSHRNLECEAIARNLADSPEIRSYPWLLIQANVESAICASTSNEKALEWLKYAAHLAAMHHYDIALSRSKQVLSAIYWTMGDTHEAWTTSIGGLQEYWAGNLPPLRGYNLLTNLDYLAYDEQQWFLQTALLRESIPIVANDPDQALRAFEQERLGEALLMTGDIEGAEASFGKTQLLFRSVPNGSRHDNLVLESEIGLARIDLLRGLAERATDRLRNVRKRINDIPDEDIALDFFQTYGLALLRAGNLSEAEENLTFAIELAERGLHFISGERDRLKWSRRNEQSYRAMVELKLRTNSTEALAGWEWYKAASLRGNGRASSLLARFQNTKSETNLRSLIDAGLSGQNGAVVTYMLLPEGLAVWVSDSKSIQERWINVEDGKLESLARRFSEHCSDSASSLAVLRLESLELYKEIVSPIEPLIRGRDVLLFEPDGDLKQISFVALSDYTGGYLGDRYAVSISPGIGYLAVSAKWSGLSRESHAVVVGDPATPGFSHLEDSDSEARSVAAVFRNSVLLLRADANYENVARSLQHSDLFHFAGHAVANRKTAGLMLSNSLLDVHGLDEMYFRSNKLVVLSACSSADGSSGLFDDDDSMARRFIGAGVPEVIASRWPVDSAATGWLMSRFYEQLVAGKTVSAALSTAARETRSRAGFQHPFYWAGFSVFGRG
jgi:CHAT domain-containing protein/cytochrome c-type biogenesis protein CcmH/NrfG